MMTPLQISTQRFVPNGKGGYRASDVDAFIQKVYKSYTKLYNDNNMLNEKLEAVSPVIDEYNKNKAAIANALISAQTVSESKLLQAQNEAQIIIEAANKNADAVFSARKAEAEKYYIEKTGEADMKLRELEVAYAKLQKEADDYRDAYLSAVNAQVEALINQANEKAADIVAMAHNDAKVAREKADEVILTANKQLEALKGETAKIKSELSALILVADTAVKSISDYKLVSEIPESEEKSDDVLKISKDDFPAFDMNIKYEPVKYAASEPVAAPAYKDEILPVALEDENEDEVIIDVVEENSSSDDMVDFFSHSSESAKQKAEMPDVSSYLSKIFDTTVTDDDDDSFGFDDLISESSKFDL